MAHILKTTASQQEAEYVEAARLLARLRSKEGQLVKAAGNKPFFLNKPDTVWVVFEGKIDVFAVRFQNQEPAGPRTYLFSAERGQALFGMDHTFVDYGLLAVGVGETNLLRLEQPDLITLAQQPNFIRPVAALLDDWVTRVSAAIAVEIPPRLYEPLIPGQEVDLPTDMVTVSQKGVVWIKHETGSSRLLGRQDLPALGRGGIFPISPHTWLQTTAQSEIVVIDTPTFMSHNPTWSHLTSFHHLILGYVANNIALAEAGERKRLAQQAEIDHSQLAQALAQFAAILEPVGPLEAKFQGDWLYQACSLVGQAQGFSLRHPPDVFESGFRADPLAEIAKASKIRVRRVALRGEWQRADSGPMLAYQKDDMQPVALLPGPRGGYTLHNPAKDSHQPVDEAVADSLHPFAHIFYRPLPERALTGLDILKFGFRGLERDLLLTSLMGLAIGLLSLITPILIGFLFDNIIPGADRLALLQLTLGLLAIAVGKTVFELTRSFALLRVESKMDGVIQAAVWDRLLRLPANFFRGYSSGDLADRAGGISLIRRALTGATLTTIITGLFSLFNFFLLFWYSWRLAVVAVGLTALAVMVLAVIGYFRLRYQRDFIEGQGDITDLVLQFTHAMAKFRVAGTERRAFAVWAKQFAKQRTVAYRSRQLTNYLTSFNTAYPMATAMAIFASLFYLVNEAGAGQTGLSLGGFLAFNAAFGQFLSAMLRLTGTALDVLRIVPIYERTRPILETTPEDGVVKSDPGQLSGDIEVNRVSFRYTLDGPLVLKEVSLRIEPREFIAFVGPSGSGKSTLLRLLLGFERPESGSVHYDGQDLEALDAPTVRRQIGVVLQHGQLTPGDIFTNIVGSSPLTLDEAWAAAEIAGLKEDIEAMPMGMHTIISEGAKTFSGGQRQRMLIAQAVVHKPRILLFDEATSALDNRTQDLVTQSLENLRATRIVVAHRLSTIINADRIYVFREGEIVQQGTYRELIDQPGPFAELAKRQLA